MTSINSADGSLIALGEARLHSEAPEFTLGMGPSELNDFLGFSTAVTSSSAKLRGALGGGRGLKQDATNS